MASRLGSPRSFPRKSVGRWGPTSDGLRRWNAALPGKALRTGCWAHREQRLAHRIRTNHEHAPLDGTHQAPIATGVQAANLPRSLLGRSSEGKLIGTERCVALPSTAFVQFLRRGICDFGGQCETGSTDGSPVRSSRIEQGGANSPSTRPGHDKQIVQDQYPSHRRGRETGIQLREPDSGQAIAREEYDGLVVFESSQQKLSSSFRVRRLTIELAVSIE